MTRLYNHTDCPDEIIRTICNWAARCAGVTGDVPVKITPAKHIRAGAHAHDAFPYRKTLIGKPTTSRDKRLLRCPIGWVEMSLPRSVTDDDALAAAEWFVDVAVHEMRHIQQFRSGYKPPEYWGKGGSGSRHGGRRQRHDSRPCEIDAENAVYEVRHNRARDKRRQELAIELALALLARHEPAEPGAHRG